MNYPESNIELALYIGERVERGYIIRKTREGQDVWINPAYHADWNMLMPVSQKVIKDLNRLARNGVNTTDIRVNIESALHSADREDCYRRIQIAIEIILRNE
jgi:hypothetical protein